VTLNDFRKSLAEAKPPAELTQALAGLWWDAKRQLGAGPRIRPAGRRTRWFVGTRLPSSLRKAIRAMQPTGIVARVSPYAENHPMRNGSASSESC